MRSSRRPSREKEMAETPQTDLEKAWKMIEKLEEMEVAQSQLEMQGYGEGPYSTRTLRERPIIFSFEKKTE